MGGFTVISFDHERDFLKTVLEHDNIIKVDDDISTLVLEHRRSKFSQFVMKPLPSFTHRLLFPFLFVSYHVIII